MIRRLSLRGWINVVLVAVVIAVGVGATKAVAANKSTGGSTRTATVQKGAVLSTVSASGTVQSTTTSDVSFSSGGTITELDVTVGQHVAKGAVIAKIDPSSAEASLSAAKFTLTSAQEKLAQAKSPTTDVQRLQDQATIQQAQDKVDSAQRALDEAESNSTTTTTVGAGGAGGSQQSSTTSVEEAEASLTSAKKSLANTKAQIAAKAKADPAQVASAQAQVVKAQQDVVDAQKVLDQTTLTAPFAGTITAVNKTVGDSVGSGSSAVGSNGGATTASSSSTSAGTTSSSSSSIVTLTNFDSLEIKAGFSESNMGKLKVGQTVNLTYDALANENETGTIERIDSSSTTVNNVVTYYVYATIKDPSDSVRPGMTATAQVVVDSRDNVLYLSNSAVTAGGSNQATVQVVKDGVTTPTTVTVGLKGDDTTEIVSGLRQGDKVQVANSSTSSSGTGFPNLGGGGLGGRGLGGGAVPGGAPPGGGR